MLLIINHTGLVEERYALSPLAGGALQQLQHVLVGVAGAS